MHARATVLSQLTINTLYHAITFMQIFDNSVKVLFGDLTIPTSFMF